MTIQAYIDDSYDRNGVYVLAGCIGSSESWAAFSDEWSKMLPNWGVLNNNNKYHFKMSEMNATPERLARVPTFLATMEKHILGYVSAKINIAELKRAQVRIAVPGIAIDWTEYDPFFVTFRALLDMFHIERKNMIEMLGEEKIDFYFDDQSQKNRIIAMWDNYIKNRPEEIRNYYGETPRFENDGDFLPLQAADLLAWWVRKMYAEETPEKIRTLDFGTFKPAKNRKLLRIEISYNEEQLVTVLKRIVRTQLGPNHLIYDSGNHSLH